MLSIKNLKASIEDGTQILKGINLKSESTGAERNMQIGGHKSGEKGGRGNGQKR